MNNTPNTPNLPAVPEEQQIERAGFRTLRQQIADADAHVSDLVAAGDTEGLGWGIASVAILLRDLRTLEGTAKRGMHEAMAANDEWELDIEGLGHFQRTFSAASKKTDWGTLRSIMRDRALVDTETGEKITDADRAVDQLLDIMFEVAPLTPSTNARTAGLKDRLGMDKDTIDDINEKQRQKPTMRFDPSSTEKKERG